MGDIEQILQTSWPILLMVVIFARTAIASVVSKKNKETK